MRIGGGEFRGRMLRTPKGEGTRPTSGLVRETLFNILASQLTDARILDLYAGCGSVGLEAIGRGASQATLVESARPAIACLQENIAALAVKEQITIFPVPVARALEQLSRRGAQFDIIFLDPPFVQVQAYLDVLQQVADRRLLDPDGVLVAQHDTRVALPDAVGALQRYRLKQLGDNALSFYRVEYT